MSRTGLVGESWADRGNVFRQDGGGVAEGGNDLLDIGPNPPLPTPTPPRKEISRDSLSRNLGPFPTFYVSGLIPGNTQGL